MPDAPAQHHHACVIGWPIGHSRSPMIHGFWLRQHGIDGSYEKRAVEPQELADFLLNLPRHGFVGCNITVPHKEAAFALLQQHAPEGLTEQAQACRAVNTVWVDEAGALHGDNTDVHGFMAHFMASVPGWQAAGKHITVLGAGGAARAIAAGFAQAGVARITIANRTLNKAEKLAEELALAWKADLRAAPLLALPKLLRETAVLVNATSLGMHGQPPLNIDLKPLPTDAVVADIVYAPLKTALLKQAEARGLKTVDGLGMLLHQAAPAFERFFGVRPEVTQELRQLVEEDLRHEQATSAGAPASPQEQAP